MRTLLLTLLTTLAAPIFAAADLAGAQNQEAPASKVEAPQRAPAVIRNAPAEVIAPPGPIAPKEVVDPQQPGDKTKTSDRASPPGKDDKPGAGADEKVR